MGKKLRAGTDRFCTTFGLQNLRAPRAAEASILWTIWKMWWRAKARWFLAIWITLCWFKTTNLTSDSTLWLLVMTRSDFTFIGKVWSDLPPESTQMSTWLLKRASLPISPITQSIRRMTILCKMRMHLKQILVTNGLWVPFASILKILESIRLSCGPKFTM